jgi:CRP-like cAMP-binding protein
MNAASRAAVGSIPKVNPPMRVLPFNSPLRAIPGIDRVSRSRIYPKGAVVFHEGSIARGVYVLSSGQVKVSISSADGKKIIIRVATGGDVLGLYAGLTGRPFEATAEMLEGGRVDFISRDDLLNLIGRQQPTDSIWSKFLAASSASLWITRGCCFCLSQLCKNSLD